MNEHQEQLAQRARKFAAVVVPPRSYDVPFRGGELLMAKQDSAIRAGVAMGYAQGYTDGEGEVWDEVGGVLQTPSDHGTVREYRRYVLDEIGKRQPSQKIRVLDSLIDLQRERVSIRAEIEALPRPLYNSFGKALPHYLEAGVRLRAVEASIESILESLVKETP